MLTKVMLKTHQFLIILLYFTLSMPLKLSASVVAVCLKYYNSMLLHISSQLCSNAM